MRVFLFTLFVSLFLGISLYTAIWYTQKHLQNKAVTENEEKVSHLDNLFAAEKVSQEAPDADEDVWEVEDDSPSAKEEAKPKPVERVAPPPAAQARKAKKPAGIARPKVDKSTHDFGSIDEGDVITHHFQILNAGNAPLKIVDFEVGCGCTMVDYPRQPIAPGKSVKIKGVFNSKDKLGPQNKLLRLVTNGKPRNIDMYFKGWVYPKDFGKDEDKKETEDKGKDSTQVKKSGKGS